MTTVTFLAEDDSGRLRKWRFRGVLGTPAADEYFWSDLASKVLRQGANNQRPEGPRAIVEPVEPEVVGLTLDTRDAEHILMEIRMSGLSRISAELERQLRDQDVDI